MKIVTGALSILFCFVLFRSVLFCFVSADSPARCETSWMSSLRVVRRRLVRAATTRNYERGKAFRTGNK